MAEFNNYMDLERILGKTASVTGSNDKVVKVLKFGKNGPCIPQIGTLRPSGSLVRLRHTGTPVNGPFLSCGFCLQAERSPAPDAIIRAQKVFVRPR